jgi:hypothetical protein
MRIRVGFHSKNTCNSDEKDYGAACNVLAGVGMGMGGGPCRS